MSSVVGELKAPKPSNAVQLDTVVELTQQLPGTSSKKKEDDPPVFYQTYVYRRIPKPRPYDHIVKLVAESARILNDLANIVVEYTPPVHTVPFRASYVYCDIHKGYRLWEVAVSIRNLPTNMPVILPSPHPHHAGVVGVVSFEAKRSAEVHNCEHQDGNLGVSAFIHGDAVAFCCLSCEFKHQCRLSNGDTIRWLARSCVSGQDFIPSVFCDCVMPLSRG